MTLLRFGLNIHPNSKMDILSISLNNDFRFLILIKISLLARFLSKLNKFFFRITPRFLNVSQYIRRDVVIFLVNNLSDLSDIIFTPLNFLKIVLRLSFSKNFINSMNDILPDLAVLDSFFHSLICFFFP